MREFFKIENDLKELVNRGRSSKGEHKGEQLKALLQEFKRDYKRTLSTKYLKNLIKGLDNRQKRNRVAYLLKLGGLKTTRQLRHYNEWANQQYKTEVVEYAHDKNTKIYPEDCILTDDEEKQLNELNQIEEQNEIKLFNRAEENLTERQRIKDAINRGGGVRVVDVRVQSVGNFFKVGGKEVLFMVRV